MMKNIGEYVSTLLMPEKKVPISREAEEKADREAEYMIKRKTTLLYLKEYGGCKIYADIRWCEKTDGDGEMVLVAPDIYFYHVRTNVKYNSVWSCITGIDGWDIKEREMWETLCMRIDNLVNLEKILREEMRHGV